MKTIKRIISIATVGAVLVTGLTGCKKEVVYTTFPDGYKLAGIDVGGMTAAEAQSTLETAAAEYTLAVNLNGYDMTITGMDLGLTVDPELDLDTLIQTVNAEDPEITPAYCFVTNDSEAIQELLTNYYITCLGEIIAEEQAAANEAANAEEDADEETADSDDADTDDSEEETEEEEELSEVELALQAVYATNLPFITYDEEAVEFVANDGITTDVLNFDDAVSAIMNAAITLEDSVTIETVSENLTGVDASSDSDIQAAVADANGYLTLDLELYYEYEGLQPTTEVMKPSDIASWIKIAKDGRSVSIDEETLFNFLTDAAGKHDRSTTRSAQFLTSAGDYITVYVPATGEEVDEQVFFDGFMEALENRCDTTVQAVYNPVEAVEGEIVDFGGSYCEVDLTNQMVYVYNNGVQVVASPCVTGCIANETPTRRGVFQIFSKDSDRYLVGEGYRTYVNYFLPFCGGIGFHDALWRGSFGGSIYLYSGSHGCINMPYSAAETLYNNVEVGTYVVVYGGADSVPGVDQTFAGTTQYDVAAGSGAFQLDTTWAGEPQTVTFTSSNPSVASVNGAGVVTPGAIGSATITVTTSQTARYHAGTFYITVNVVGNGAGLNIPNLNLSYNLDNGISAGNIGASAASGGTIRYEVTTGANIVSVDPAGNITLTGEMGTATITVTVDPTATCNGASATVTVTVTGTPVTP